MFAQETWALPVSYYTNLDSNPNECWKNVELIHIFSNMLTYLCQKYVVNFKICEWIISVRNQDRMLFVWCQIKYI